MKKVANQYVTEVLIKWVGAQDIINTWEQLDKLKESQPHFMGKVL